MSDFQKETKVLEKVGECEDGGEVYHRLTKGGLSQMIKIRRGGAHKILGQGNHRAVARVMANSMEKNIAWHASLFKNEEMDLVKTYEQENKLIPESTDRNHIAQAVWHTQQQQNSNPTDKLYHSLSALGHYNAAGLDKMKALEAINLTMGKLNKSYTMDKPFDEDLLRIAYEKRTGKSFPSGE